MVSTADTPRVYFSIKVSPSGPTVSSESCPAWAAITAKDSLSSSSSLAWNEGYYLDKISWLIIYGTTKIFRPYNIYTFFKSKFLKHRVLRPHNNLANYIVQLCKLYAIKVCKYVVRQFPCNLEDSFDAPHIISEVMTSDVLISYSKVTNQMRVISSIYLYYNAQYLEIILRTYLINYIIKG